MPAPTTRKREATVNWHKRLAEIRQAVADYMRTEGCGCCANRQLHREDEERLAQLLRVPKYVDGSGYDFGRYESRRAATFPPGERDDG